MALSHGGNLLQIAAQYGSEPGQWLDLSTGVSPFTYPVGEIPHSVWNALPQENDGLEQAARDYYCSPVEPLPLAGSQAAIMALPSVLSAQLNRCGTIALPAVGYKEHQRAWQGFALGETSWQLGFYQDLPDEQQIADSDVVLVINPNNPAGHHIQRERLWQIADQLAAKGSWLVVDEAFADSDPAQSLLATDSWPENLIVLRSVGKFFGLAGARVGFLFAPAQVRELMREQLGPWTVSGPSRWVVRQALADSDWQQKNRQRIRQASERLNRLLTRYLSSQIAGTALFTTVSLDDAPAYHHLLCQQMILTRLCDEKNALRFGLPADESGWNRLENALIGLQQAITKDKD